MHISEWGPERGMVAFIPSSSSSFPLGICVFGGGEEIGEKKEGTEKGRELGSQKRFNCKSSINYSEVRGNLPLKLF